jgi:hypothetical protein
MSTSTGTGMAGETTSRTAPCSGDSVNSSLSADHLRLLIWLVVCISSPGVEVAIWLRVSLLISWFEGGDVYLTTSSYIPFNLIT